MLPLSTGEVFFPSSAMVCPHIEINLLQILIIIIIIMITIIILDTYANTYILSSMIRNNVNYYE